MKRMRLAGLCLVAALALGALAASAAQATLPEWGHCVAQKKGEYTSSNCKTKAAKAHKGAFEWLAGAETRCYAKKKGEYSNAGCTTRSSKPHKGKYEKTGGGKFEGNAGIGILYGKVYSCEDEEENYIGPAPKADCYYYYFLGVEIACKTEHATGEAVGTKEIANVSVRFTGCTGIDGTVPVQSKGLPEGEVETYKLKGRIGYLNKAATPEPEVGVLLQPAEPHGLFAQLDIGLVGGPEVSVGEGSSTIEGGLPGAPEGSFYETTGPGEPTGNDGVISPIEPVDAMTSTFTQNYTIGTGVASKYGNIPDKFEGASEPVYLLEDRQHGPGPEYTSSWGPASEKITNVNTLTEGTAEIKG